jgi:asparagine synthase (glutamine-hydrolysing)
MCGIAGIFAYDPAASLVDREELLRTRDAMIQRGPDGAGLWISPDNRVGLAHRRLAIIDLTPKGAQPMATLDGQLRITFNGEIYNYLELRRELEVKGVRFQSGSDTEVLLHLYAERGAQMVDVLRGMYAFAIWDERRRGLFLARDPFGIKPLYCADDGGAVRFASQVKALLSGGAIDTSPEPAGHVGFFLWGHLPEPYTLYKGVRALPAGSTLWIDSMGRRKERRFFSVSGELAEAGETPLACTRDEMRERLRTALADSVSHHMIADVPVGVFLSAGLDSCTITALARESTGADLRTVTLGFGEFEGGENDEAPLAALVARQYQTSHLTRRVTRDQFRSEYDRLMFAMDQPSIDGVNSYFISKAAAEAGLKVALSGLGGDEMFGGYPSFRQIPRVVKALSPLSAIPRLGRGFRAVCAPVLKHFTSPKYAGLLEYGGTYGGAYLLRRGMFMPWELPEILDGEMVREGWGELQTLSRLEQTVAGVDGDRQRIQALETTWYMRNQLLRDADWAGMAHSLEIRLPLVDIELFRTAARLRHSGEAPGKRDMALTPDDPLPRAVLERKKTGFVTPVRDWLAPEKGSSSAPRGMRGWSATVYKSFTCAQVLGQDISPPVAVVFRTGQLGDTLVAMPAMDLIRRRFPDHRFVLLTDRQPAGSGYVSAWDLCRPTGWFDQVIFYDPRAQGWSAWKSRLALLRRLRGLGIDQFFNMAPGRSSRQAGRDAWFFGRMVRPRVYHPPATLRTPRPDPHKALPRVEPEWRHTLESLGAQGAQDASFRLPIPAFEREAALLLARRAGVDFGTRLLAFGPGSKMAAKRWPAERFALVGLHLRDAFPGVQFVVLGGAEDVEVGDALCSGWGPRSYNFAGRLSPFSSAALLEKCVAYVGNDTGTMHLAAMSGTPCVAIFSARDLPGRWDPCSRRSIVLRKDVECAGCLLEVCEKYDNKCLTQIAVDEVFATTSEILAGSMTEESR